MTAPAIDLNADLGEGSGDDGALLEVVTSANVACGFHAGDSATMRAVCAAAAERGVVIGAHVGYDDREGFGRRELDVAADDLEAQATEQIAALRGAAAAAGTTVRYVKPHGALYDRCTQDADAARAVVLAAAAAGLPAVLGLPGSVLLAVAERAGLAAIAEGFADRRYAAAAGGPGTTGGSGTQPAGDAGAVRRLVDRGSRGALLDPDEAMKQAVLLARDGLVVAADGTSLRVAVRSICVHGDSPSAVILARGVRSALDAVGVGLAPFA